MKPPRGYRKLKVEKKGKPKVKPQRRDYDVALWIATGETMRKVKK